MLWFQMSPPECFQQNQSIEEDACISCISNIQEEELRFFLQGHYNETHFQTGKKMKPTIKTLMIFTGSHDVNMDYYMPEVNSYLCIQCTSKLSELWPSDYQVSALYINFLNNVHHSLWLDRMFLLHSCIRAWPAGNTAASLQQRDPFLFISHS